MPGNDTARIAKSAAERASDCLAEAYSEPLDSGGPAPGDFEARALEIAHGAAALWGAVRFAADVDGGMVAVGIGSQG